MLELNEIHNPFPGIRPFEMDETNLFFGRDGQSDELLKRMQRTRLLAVVGTSGSGKSSLIRAGLLPALYGGLMGDAGSSWRIAIQRPGGDPIGNLAAALADPNVFGSESNSEIQTALLETTLRRSSIGLIDVAREARMPQHENLLLVVDQFEELFRFKQSQTGDDATTFVKLLLEASAQKEIPIYIIITMRSDFLGDCSQFTGLPEAINNGQYLIPRMSRDERQSAIVGPIAVGEGKITASLVSRLLNDVGDNPDQLPILQHALMRTWDYWSAHRRNGGAIGLEDYTAIGTMAEALSRHADEAFNELPDERQREIAEKLFKRLTEKGTDNREVRRPTALAELCAVCEASDGDIKAIVDVFRREGRSFLMPPVGTKLTNETVIDISHESLIRNWQRLQQWVNEEAQSSRTYRRLAEAAVLHREGSEGLLQDPGLQVALDWFEKNKPNAAWAQRYHPEFELAKQYLTESCEAREEAQRELERQRNAELDRARREREQAETYAAAQAAAAHRLRRFTFALVVISILALAAAGGAVFAFAAAKQSMKIALIEKANAEQATKELAQTNETVARNRDALKTMLDQLNASEEDRKRKAELANERAAQARIAETRAESEAKKARDREIEARTAQSLAEGNARRGELSQDTLESLQRGNFKLAHGALDDLVISINAALNDPKLKLSTDERQRLTVELGWARAHEGTAWLGTYQTENAASSYEMARKILEQVWPKEKRDPEDSAPILYETYDGLGKTYQMMALATPNVAQQEGSANYFKKAEDLFNESLDYHTSLLPKKQAELKAVEARAIVESHFHLARLYRDMGANDKAEQQFKEIEKFSQAQANELAQARRELAELYRDQNRYGEAVAAYKNLILQQENAAIYDPQPLPSMPAQDVERNFSRYGQDIANSYNELADAYRGWADATTDKAQADEMSARADAAFGLSVALQRFAVRLRRYLSASESSGPTDRDDLADNVGDAYLKFDKAPRAAVFYLYALDVRKGGSSADEIQVGKSYDKLGNLYRGQKDYAKAEQNYKDQVSFYQGNAQSAEYAKAVRDLATLYGDNPNAAPDLAITKYREALAIYHSLHDWFGEDVVLYRLTKLYEKRQQPEARMRALEERVTALAPYYEQLVSGAFKKVNEGPNLISEYLQAINVLGYSLAQNNDLTRAETTYERAWEMRKYLSTNVRFVKDDNTRTLYDAMLGEYQHLLTRQQKTALATEVRDFRDKFNRADERSKVVQASAK
jgi:hypothetical protein